MTWRYEILVPWLINKTHKTLINAEYLYRLVLMYARADIITAPHGGYLAAFAGLWRQPKQLFQRFASDVPLNALDCLISSLTCMGYVTYQRLTQVYRVSIAGESGRTIVVMNIRLCRAHQKRGCGAQTDLRHTMLRTVRVNRSYSSF
jgi:hypothetical protein